MMQTAQIGEVAAQHPSVAWEPQLPAFAQYSGWLGNQRAQAPASSEFAEEQVWLLAMVRRTSRLTILKRQVFTAEGRAQRIKASLDALNAPQPTALTLEQWKGVVAEAEEDDED